MKNISFFFLFLILAIQTGFESCGTKRGNNNMNDASSTYGYNREFLSDYTTIIELKSNGSRLILAPEWQGRVMTSSCEGDNGFSFGWINHDLIKSGEVLDHINPFGGEERLWLGPEGGQFSLFFKQGATFDFGNWQTPAILDREPFDVMSIDSTSAKFYKKAALTNYSGTELEFSIERVVSLLQEGDVADDLGIELDGIGCVAYRSENILTNTGSQGWTRDGGMLSIWMLGMFNPSPVAVVVIPVAGGNDSLLGPKVNDNYFGKIGEERLQTGSSHIFFRADGKSRGKIGIPPQRIKGIMGSWDDDIKALTILICDLPHGITDYVNSSWELQERPFSGDAYNSYNDGPLEDGSVMGPFYELETSSPALALEPGKSHKHTQTTIHLMGNEKQLDKISRKVLNISLKEIRSAF